MIWLLLTLPGLFLGLCTVAALVQANRCDGERPDVSEAAPESAPLRLAGVAPSFKVY